MSEQKTNPEDHGQYAVAMADAIIRQANADSARMMCACKHPLNGHTSDGCWCGCKVAISGSLALRERPGPLVIAESLAEVPPVNPRCVCGHEFEAHGVGIYCHHEYQNGHICNCKEYRATQQVPQAPIPRGLCSCGHTFDTHGDYCYMCGCEEFNEDPKTIPPD